MCVYMCVCGGGGVELFRALLSQKVLMSPPVCPRGAWQEKVLSLRKNPWFAGSYARHFMFVNLSNPPHNPMKSVLC